MIVLFTDFGASDIYVAQMKAVLLRDAPAGTPVLDLLHAVPNFDARAGAHLLAALAPQFPTRSVFVAVVDPGVGSDRTAVALEADGRWFVGPDNGLLSVIAARAGRLRIERIVWRPHGMSNSFHGRDLFAPIAALLAGGHHPDDRLAPVCRLSVELGADDLYEAVYIDHFGNVITGLRAASIATTSRMRAGGHTITWARTFADAPANTPFWYQNSIGLVEIALPLGSASARLGLGVGERITVIGND